MDEAEGLIAAISNRGFDGVETVTSEPTHKARSILGTQPPVGTIARQGAIATKSTPVTT
ncbi:hypothetical protein [Aminobacter sp. HY435]|uniref:hypothetical protein n=1 Tax=Aminobacter sp. HY435 TaxID=2970917 RepID=UPI0022B9AF62|nr:hypothetical protein [Aminobacter sp. HY435]